MTNSEIGKIDIQDFFVYVKNRCSSHEYTKYISFNIIDVILEYCNKHGLKDDGISDLIDAIKNNKMIYEYIEIEAKKKRLILDKDYAGRLAKSLNSFNKTHKKSLLSIFKKVK